MILLTFFKDNESIISEPDVDTYFFKVTTVVFILK